MWKDYLRDYIRYATLVELKIKTILDITMFSKRDLKAFLEKISPDAQFVKFEYVSAEKFSIDLKCKVEKDGTPEFYSQYSAEWIKKFSKFTATAWIVRSCFSKLKRLLHRKIFVCHRSSHNKKKKPNFESRNQDCRAKIEFRTKFINRNTIKNDPLLKAGLNLTISIDFDHTHKVRGREAFNMLKSTSETDRVFEEYFDTGCLPAATKLYHELTLLDKYGEKCPEVFSNATINPSVRHILYLYEKRKKEAIENSTFHAIMEAKKEHLEAEGFTVNFSSDQTTTILIVTPLMKRVVMELGLDHILIDSTQVPNGPMATLYYVPSKLGALPFACVIHTGQTETDFFQAHFSVKLALESELISNFEPKICMMSKPEQKLMDSLCKTTKLMLSRYSLCSDAWRCLNEECYKVERKKKHGIMFLIKSLLYADTSESLEKAYNKLKENEQVTSKLEELVNDLWEKRDEWMVVSEDNLNNNLVEMSVRLIKEFIIKRCKSFNSIIMVDVVTKILENHHRRVLASYIRDSNIVATYTKFLSKAQVVLSFGSDVRRISANEYRIDGQARHKKYFRTDTMCCDCQHGKKGQFCEHLCAIINTVDTDVMKTPLLSEEEKKLFVKLAGDVEEVCKVIKPELSEDVKDIVDCEDDKGDIEKQDCTNDSDYAESAASSPRPDNYFCLEVKTERCNDDPLNQPDNQGADEFHYPIDNTTANDVPSTSNHSAEMKKKYETALKAVNDEFRRLNRFFSENPNSSNLETMARLARELSKIRPVEKVNLENLQIKLNHKKKRKRNYRD